MTKPALRKSKERTLQAQTCYEYLRRHLLHRQLTPGSRLIEEKWAGIIGVNRSALRESLTLLAHEGLLECGARGGFFVPELDRQAIDEILEVRLAMEVGALRLLQLRNEIEPYDFGKLRENCEVMVRMHDSGFEFGFVEADRHFHELIVELSQNPRMIRVYQQAALPLAPLPQVDETSRHTNMKKTISEHNEICELLESEDITGAIALLERHLMVNHRLVGVDAEEVTPVESLADPA